MMFFHAGYGQDMENPLSGSQSTTPPNAGSNATGYPDTNGNYNPGQRSTIYPQTAPPRSYDLNGEPGSDQSSSRSRQTREEEWTTQFLNRLPPEPPTEFQQMVASTLGSMLPIYGAKLFRNTPSTFAPLDKVPVTLDYAIGPGDELQIQIWGQITLNSRFIVDRSGNIFIPQVGSVHVAGQSFGNIREYLRSQVAHLFHNFDMNVAMGQLRSIQIFVVGQARRPGSYTVSSLSTLVDALFVTGGPTAKGSMRHIQLKRGGKVVADFDLYDLLQRGDKSGDMPLLPADVIYIPPVGPQVAIAGSVNQPAIYELKAEAAATVADALALASGRTNVAAGDRLRLERVDARAMRSVMDLKLDAAGLATPLRDGDIVELASITGRYKDSVTLRGNVANPGHYVWHPQMHVAELFPDKDALITRDYWIKRGQLGKPVLSYLPPCPRKRTQANETGNPEEYRTAPQSTAPQSNTQTRNNTDRQQNPQRMMAEEEEEEGCVPDERDIRNANAEATQRRQTQEQTIPGSAMSIRDEQATQQARDQQQRIQQQMAASGSAADAMLARASSQFEPRNDVKLSEPDIDWSYAVIERQDKNTLTTSLLPFNLGHLVLDGDASQNLELQPGDVVTIFSKADIRVPQAEQTRFVHLEGEFVSAGIYSVRPGETLQSLVERAGGFTRDAYLYGSEFTRESTRRLQQQRLSEYVDQIALHASTNSVNSTGRSLSALDSTAAVAAAAQSQVVIANLRQLRASGRIVLQMTPDSNTIAQLPPILLEDGDRFIVPHRPSTVSVAGAVYNPNAFLYDGQRRLRDYLKLAGGPNRDADRKSVYVIRADGSVVSRREMSSWYSQHFDTLRIYPGDTIVMPLNLSKGTTLRNIVDIAQIAGQFGLAAAAATVVF